MLMEATDFAAAISRTETARSDPPQLYNFHSTGSSSSIELGFPRALGGSGMPRILRLVYRGFDTADRFPRALAVFCLHRDIAAALAAMPDSDPERPVADQVDGLG